MINNQWVQKGNITRLYEDQRPRKSILLLFFIPIPILYLTVYNNYSHHGYLSGQDYSLIASGIVIVSLVLFIYILKSVRFSKFDLNNKRITHSNRTFNYSDVIKLQYSFEKEEFNSLTRGSGQVMFINIYRVSLILANNEKIQVVRCFVEEDALNLANLISRELNIKVEKV